MRAWLLLLSVCAGACALSPREQPQLVVPDADGGVPGQDAAALAPDDTDHDGLCNETEKDLGTDPESLDTDGDGFPDLAEVMAEHDPTDALSPGLHEVAYLPARRGSERDFEARVTVEGMGEGYVGLFAAYPSLNADDLTANDFFEKHVALTAEPPENLFGEAQASERFGSVVGRTRLSFRLTFTFERPEPDFECVESFPFSYGAKDDLGRKRGVADYMLIVVPEGSTALDASSYCVPTACF